MASLPTRCAVPLIRCSFRSLCCCCSHPSATRWVFRPPFIPESLDKPCCNLVAQVVGYSLTRLRISCSKKARLCVSGRRLKSPHKIVAPLTLCKNTCIFRDCSILSGLSVFPFPFQSPCRFTIVNGLPFRRNWTYCRFLPMVALSVPCTLFFARCTKRSPSFSICSVFLTNIARPNDKGKSTGP